MGPREATVLPRLRKTDTQGRNQANNVLEGDSIPRENAAVALTQTERQSCMRDASILSAENGSIVRGKGKLVFPYTACPHCCYSSRCENSIQYSTRPPTDDKRHFYFRVDVSFSFV